MWKSGDVGRKWAELDGQRWRLAEDGDHEEAVPKLPEI
jgi:hypothetical protein